MKKLYIFLSLLLATSANVYSEDIDPTWEIIGFDKGEWPTIENDTIRKTLEKGNSAVTVSFIKSKHQNPLPDAVIDGERYEDITFIQVFDESNSGSKNNNSLARSSYVLFEIPEGKDHIKKVEILGYSMQSISYFVEAYSKTDNKVNSYNLTKPGGDGEPWGEYLSYSQAFGGGNIDQAKGADIAGSTEDLESIRNVRFNWCSKEFGNVMHSTSGLGVIVTGMRIYTELTGVTGIENDENTNKMNIIVQNNQLELNQLADVVIYNTLGHVVATKTNTKEVLTVDLAKGIYIVKATSNENSKNVITKKFIK